MTPSVNRTYPLDRVPERCGASKSDRSGEDRHQHVTSDRRRPGRMMRAARTRIGRAWRKFAQVSFRRQSRERRREPQRTRRPSHALMDPTLQELAEVRRLADQEAKVIEDELAEVMLLQGADTGLAETDLASTSS